MSPPLLLLLLVAALGATPKLTMALPAPKSFAAYSTPDYAADASTMPNTRNTVVSSAVASGEWAQQNADSTAANTVNTPVPVPSSSGWPELVELIAATFPDDVLINVSASCDGDIRTVHLALRLNEGQVVLHGAAIPQGRATRFTVESSSTTHSRTTGVLLAVEKVQVDVLVLVQLLPGPTEAAFVVVPSQPQVAALVQAEITVLAINSQPVVAEVLMARIAIAANGDELGRSYAWFNPQATALSFYVSELSTPGTFTTDQAFSHDGDSSSSSSSSSSTSGHSEHSAKEEAEAEFSHLGHKIKAAWHSFACWFHTRPTWARVALVVAAVCVLCLLFKCSLLLCVLACRPKRSASLLSGDDDDDDVLATGHSAASSKAGKMRTVTLKDIKCEYAPLSTTTQI